MRTRWAALIALALILAGLAGASPASAQVDRLVVSPDGPYTSLSAALADAQGGDVIEVRGGTHPGPLVIDKSVALEGVDWPVIDGGGQGTVVHLTAPDSAIRGFQIQGSGAEPDRDHAGITLEAPRTVAENNRLTDVLFGIFVAQADDAIVRGNEITGKPQYDLGRKGDGIRLWYSQRVLVEGNHVFEARDVVVWYSSDAIIRDNVIENGRYGVHLMYCDRIIIERNRILNNSVGIYVMYSYTSTLSENTISGQRGPSGYALAFKDADDVTAVHNVLNDNRVGIFVDGTPFTQDGFAHFGHNIIALNDVGVMVQPAVRRAEFRDNTFWENVQQVSVQGGGGSADANVWQRNYWSDYTGFDADGDGVGDMPYRAERLFESMYDREERLRALIYSPAADAIEFAAATFPVVKPQPKLVDEAPRSEPAPIPAFVRQPGSGAAASIAAAALVMALGAACGVAAVMPARTHYRNPNKTGGETGMALPGELSGTSPILVHGVSKRYGKVRALDGVSFDAARGEAVALWGPNGAGKTTLIKAMLGLIAFEGHIEVAGFDVQRKGKQARSQMGYVPQEAIFYDWTVQETMAFYARLKKADASSTRIPALLERLGLGEHIKKRTTALSGGLKQRLALAIALLSDPPVLLLDEPTANLDAAARSDYLKLLSDLRAEGKVIVFASHRLEELNELADRVIVLNGGKLAEITSPDDLRRRVARDLKLTLWIVEAERLAALNLLTGKGLDAHFNGRGTVVVQVAADGKMEPLETLAKQGIKVLDFELEQIQSWN